MSAIALASHQFRYDQRVFWRNPASVFFTVLLPLIFLFIFCSIFGGDTVEERGNISIATYYVPGILTLAVVSATLVSLAIALVEARESGRLKRVRSTPLPTWASVAGRIGNALVISLLMTAVVTLIGFVIYDVEVPSTTVPALLVTLLVGAFAFSSLGFALTALIPNEDAAPAITNVAVLPLYFLSGVFIPDTEIPDGVLDFASVFPIRNFFEAVFTAFDPATTGTGFEWGHLGIVALWGAGGLVLAMRFFRWSPRG
jgi:ABC-2 type transport system permease protein